VNKKKEKKKTYTNLIVFSWLGQIRSGQILMEDRFLAQNCGKTSDYLKRTNNYFIG